MRTVFSQVRVGERFHFIDNGERGARCYKAGLSSYGLTQEPPGRRHVATRSADVETLGMPVDEIVADWHEGLEQRAQLKLRQKLDGAQDGQEAAEFLQELLEMAAYIKCPERPGLDRAVLVTVCAQFRADKAPDVLTQEEMDRLVTSDFWVDNRHSPVCCRFELEIARPDDMCIVATVSWGKVTVDGGDVFYTDPRLRLDHCVYSPDSRTFRMQSNGLEWLSKEQALSTLLMVPDELLRQFVLET